MSHHVSVRLPDGRDAMADYRLPITAIMRRINKRIMEDPDNQKGTGTGSAVDLADKAEVAKWLDQNPEQVCTTASVLSGCHQEMSP